MKVGFANGCFDLFHEGHRHFLRTAAEQCGYLIVAVNSDAWCRLHKGNDRPFRTLSRRLHDVRAFVDTLTDCAVIPFQGREEPLVASIGPDVLFAGYDHAPHTRSMTLPGMQKPISVIHVAKLGAFSTTLQAQQRKAAGGRSDGTARSGLGVRD